MGNSEKILFYFVYSTAVTFGIPHGQLLDLTALQFHHFALLLDLLLVVDGNNSPTTDFHLVAGLGYNNPLFTGHHLLIPVKGDEFSQRGTTSRGLALHAERSTCHGRLGTSFELDRIVYSHRIGAHLKLLVKLFGYLLILISQGITLIQKNLQLTT